MESKMSERMIATLGDIRDAESVEELAALMVELGEEDRVGAVLEAYRNRKGELTVEPETEAVEVVEAVDVVDEKKEVTMTENEVLKQLMVKLVDLEKQLAARPVAATKGGPRAGRRYHVVNTAVLWCNTPQVLGLMEILAANADENGWITDEQVNRLVETHRHDVLRIRGRVQTGWRVFCYYRKDLVEHNNIEMVG
jgi:hypothetical protein